MLSCTETGGGMDAGRRRDKITKRLTKRLDRARLLQASASDPRIQDCTFAVLDVEATGITANDRVIEVGLVRFTADGQAADHWGTLLNPGRDLREYGIHRLGRFEYVRHGPSFEDIAGDLCQRLTGTVLAAHNVTYDLRMISQEYESLGLELPQLPTLCTLQLGVALGQPHRRLEECCLQLGIPGPGASHTALADAQAASRLLAFYLLTLQAQGVRTLRDLGCEVEIPAPEAWPALRPSGLSYLREVHDAQPRSYLAKLVQRLPGSGSPEEIGYLDLLDRALEDFVLTPEEVASLYEFARSSLAPDQIHALHRRYLRDLVAAAWEDGVVTQEETLEIGMVANLLGIPNLEVERLIREARPGQEERS